MLHRRHNDAANIINMDAVEQLSFAFNNPCGAIAQPVKGAAAGAIDTGGTENFRIKQCLPALFRGPSCFPPRGCRFGRCVFIAKALWLVGIDRGCRHIAGPAGEGRQNIFMGVQHRVAAPDRGNCAYHRIDTGKRRCCIVKWLVIAERIYLPAVFGFFCQL